MSNGDLVKKMNQFLSDSILLIKRKDLDSVKEDQICKDGSVKQMGGRDG